MQKNKKNIIWVLVLVVLILGFGFYIINKNENSLGDDVVVVDDSQNQNTKDLDNQKAFDVNKYRLLGKADDLIIFSIFPDTRVSGIRSYRGSIKGGWFFEANILVNVLDANKKVLLKSNAHATTDWMTADAVEFEGNIDFTKLPKGTAFIQIKNDNPSDDRTKDKEVLVPVTIM